jgi:MYXO-CTERM domain-containing protein
VFVRSGGAWTQQAKLLANDKAAQDQFGVSVALTGDPALVGAHQDDDGGKDSGAAYVFARSSGVWTQQAKLLPNDGAEYDWFGVSVALTGDTALVGASGHIGSAYVFARSSDVWTQQAKLLANDGAENDRFGVSVALSEDMALVGAAWDDDKAPNAGAVYVFVPEPESVCEDGVCVPGTGVRDITVEAGCGCRTAPQTGSGPALPLLALGLPFVLRRRVRGERPAFGTKGARRRLLTSLLELW